MWDVNVKGPWRLIQTAFPHLKASGAGRVVAVASMSGKRVKSATMTGYSMSKFALVGLIRGVRHSGWAHGLRATAICPGYVATDMTADADFPAAAMTSPERPSPPWHPWPSACRTRRPCRNWPSTACWSRDGPDLICSIFVPTFGAPAKPRLHSVAAVGPVDL
jgi:NAD(P)-dependent dehydrogenase (short-subunit alcohol dehydrogenase family)